jgi:hypothetical protein
LSVNLFKEVFIYEPFLFSFVTSIRYLRTLVGHNRFNSRRTSYPVLRSAILGDGDILLSNGILGETPRLDVFSLARGARKRGVGKGLAKISVGWVWRQAAREITRSTLTIGIAFAISRLPMASDVSLAM